MLVKKSVKGVFDMTNYEKFKQALKRRQEESYELLMQEVKKVKETVERLLTLAFESSASQARTNYTGLEMY